ncbi:unnamed protein product, partial [Meganyctiphanes norvegica]
MCCSRLLLYILLLILTNVHHTSPQITGNSQQESNVIIHHSDCRDDIPDCYNKDCTVDKIKFKCFKTCGFCNEGVIDGECKDEAEICPKMSMLCKQHYVGRLCRETCNTCVKEKQTKLNPSDCRDDIPDCYNKDCTVDKIKFKCFKTCGFCNEVAMDGICKDEAGICPKMSRLCKQYYVGRLCRKTCNNCGKGQSANKLLPKENTPPESNKNILY